MRKVNRFIGILLLLAIWFTFSVFYYFQHQIEVEYYDVNRYIAYENFGVLIKNVERYDFEAKPIDYPDFVYKLNLPRSIGNLFFDVMYFYSIPYDRNSIVSDYRINCEVIFDSNNIDSNSLGKIIDNRFEVLVADPSLDSTTSLTLVSAREWGSSSNENIIYYSFGGHWKEIYSDGITLVDNNKDIKYEIPFDREFIKESYGYFNRRPPSRQSGATDIINSFLSNYYEENSAVWKEYVKGEYLDVLSTSELDEFNHFSAIDYYLSYVGDYMNEDQVFCIKTRGNDSAKELDFYMKYDDLKWQIIHIE